MRNGYITTHALARKHELCVFRPEEVFSASHSGIILFILSLLKANHHEEHLFVNQGHLEAPVLENRLRCGWLKKKEEKKEILADI